MVELSELSGEGDSSDNEKVEASESSTLKKASCTSSSYSRVGTNCASSSYSRVGTLAAVASINID